jgi:hypothetical protein
MLDSKSESVDFDRVISKTDAMLRYDKFNQLRIRNNMANDRQLMRGQANEHMRHHQVRWLDCNRGVGMTESDNATSTNRISPWWTSPDLRL